MGLIDGMMAGYTKEIEWITRWKVKGVLVVQMGSNTMENSKMIRSMDMGHSFDLMEGNMKEAD